MQNHLLLSATTCWCTDITSNLKDSFLGSKINTSRKADQTLRAQMYLHLFYSSSKVIVSQKSISYQIPNMDSSTKHSYWPAASEDSLLADHKAAMIFGDCSSCISDCCLLREGRFAGSLSSSPEHCAPALIFHYQWFPVNGDTVF